MWNILSSNIIPIPVSDPIRFMSYKNHRVILSNLDKKMVTVDVVINQIDCCNYFNSLKTNRESKEQKHRQQRPKTELQWSN